MARRGEDEASLDAALKGVDIVVHCARGKGNDNSVTTGGTRMLIERIQAAGVSKLVFTSSVAVYGEATGIVGEDTPPVQPVTEYGQGKRDAMANVSSGCCQVISRTPSAETTC